MRRYFLESPNTGYVCYQFKNPKVDCRLTSNCIESNVWQLQNSNNEVYVVVLLYITRGTHWQGRLQCVCVGLFTGGSQAKASATQPTTTA